MNSTELKQKWEMVMKLIESSTVTPIAYDTWFVPLVPKKIDKKQEKLYFSVYSEMVKNIINTRYLELLEESVNTAFGEKYNVVIDVEESPSISDSKDDDLMGKNFKEEFYFNPRYNFSTFVIANNNKYAHAAAVAVAESPSEAYNPLFIYGGSGLGKTHLMHAIGHYIIKNNPKLNVLYVSSEMFTNELIKAISSNKTSEFKNKYRKIDVLLIDDIQFIEGKERTQEEFFHTFNALHSANKQIVISSDRPPNKLTNIEDRLRSRFQWNMIADINPPDYETRVAILQKKAEFENIDIDNDMQEVINLIAEKIKLNIRELEGAFTRMISFSNLMNEKINVSFARNILKDIITNSDFNITHELIKKYVCKYFNIKISDMESSKRTRNFSYPRQIAMYLCREMTDLSLPKIGEAFGGRDHTTVLHAYEKIKKELKTDDNLKDIIKALQKQLNEK